MIPDMIYDGVINWPGIIVLGTIVGFFVFDAIMSWRRHRAKN